MPDWSYRTIFRPLLFRLPPRLARDLALGVLGRLGGALAGRFAIDFMGHMRPDPRLARSIDGIVFPSPVGLGAGVDEAGAAVFAFARFGFGLIEIGPVTQQPLRRTTGEAMDRDDCAQTIDHPDPPDNAGVNALAERLGRVRPGPGSVPLVARLAPTAECGAAAGVSEFAEMATVLAPSVRAFAVETGGLSARDPTALAATLRAILDAIRAAAPCQKVWLVVPADAEVAEATARVRTARAVGYGGVVIDGSVRDGLVGRRMGRPAREPARALVRALRTEFGPELLVVASGGVHEPADALDLLDSGASVVLVDSGLVFAGPGLPKRINEAALYALEQTATAPTATPADAGRTVELAWFWLLLLGAGMFIGSTLAFAIAATRVVLPYDEQFVGLSRPALAAANARLLPFMTHDRVSLAGSMVTTAVMYCGLAWFGVRRGVHWARVSIQTSAFAGFATFFLFLGFGYFDPFHAFVTSALLQLLLLGVHSRLSPPAARPAPDLHETPRWRCALWGQLLFVTQAAAFIVAGFVISAVGATTVFVPEDLQYMHTSAHSLGRASARLLPLIAHDRATFGGMLVASGLVFLTSALWGFRRGERWLWWTTLAAGAPGYAAAIGVHYAVGYKNGWHLAPAFAGAALFAAGLALSYPYLCRRDPALEREWAGRVGRRVG